MANKTIPNLTAAAAAALTDLIEVSQGGSSFKETLQQVKDLLQPYKVYRALLSQDGTPGNAPTATVLENTIGAIVWTYTAAGEYTGTLAGAFTANKTFAITVKTPVLAGVATLNAAEIIRTSANTVVLNQYNDITLPALGDGFTDLPVEILVYP